MDDEYALSEQQILTRELEKLRLLGEEFLYSGYYPRLNSRVLTTGNYLSSKSPDVNKIWACTLMTPPEVEEKGIWHTDGKPIFDYGFTFNGNPYGMIAVYDRSQFEWPTEIGDDGQPFIFAAQGKYQFKHPENKLAALVAVVKIITR